MIKKMITMVMNIKQKKKERFKELEENKEKER